MIKLGTRPLTITLMAGLLSLALCGIPTVEAAPHKTHTTHQIHKKQQAAHTHHAIKIHRQAAKPTRHTTKPQRHTAKSTHRTAKSQTRARIAQRYPTVSLSPVTWNMRQQQGKRYRFGGSNPSTGFDCSGLTQYAFKRGAGIQLPRTAAAQYQVAQKVPRSAARQGDLVFFQTRGRRIGHVGVYLGNGKFIHAPSSGKRVTTTPLTGYWSKRLVGFGRVGR